jgi:hypothetical protein
VNCAGFYFFEAVGLFADIDDLRDSNVPPLQQTDSLPAARFAFGIGITILIVFLRV